MHCQSCGSSAWGCQSLALAASFVFVYGDFLDKRIELCAQERHFGGERKDAHKQNGDNTKEYKIGWRFEAEDMREEIGNLRKEAKKDKECDEKKPEDRIGRLEFRLLYFADDEIKNCNGAYYKKNAKS